MLRGESKNVWGSKTLMRTQSTFSFLNPQPPHLAHNTGDFSSKTFFNMSTIPSTPGAGPSRPSRPRPWPVITTPTQPRIEDEDLEIMALTKKINALREKRA